MNLLKDFLCMNFRVLLILLFIELSELHCIFQVTLKGFSQYIRSELRSSKLKKIFLELKELNFLYPLSLLTLSTRLGST